jgi:hypothetical protein
MRHHHVVRADGSAWPALGSVSPGLVDRRLQELVDRARRFLAAISPVLRPNMVEVVFNAAVRAETHHDFLRRVGRAIELGSGESPEQYLQSFEFAGRLDAASEPASIANVHCLRDSDGRPLSDDQHQAFAFRYLARVYRARQGEARFALYVAAFRRGRNV